MSTPVTDRVAGAIDGPVRVGVDLLPVADVAESVATFGDRYLQRIYTPQELASSRTPTDPDGAAGTSECSEDGSGYSYQSLAARFAAKEAVVKVLRPVGPRPAWRSIEVVRQPGGWCELRLTGLAARLAAQAGIDRWAVSLTHEATMAAAVVVGQIESLDRHDRGRDRGEA
jgi:holo-[acyl-carrier protein] synthase